MRSVGDDPVLRLTERIAMLERKLERLITQPPPPGGSGGGATTFRGLTDTPSSYSGQALKYTRVNSGATGLEFAAITYGELIGIPPVFYPASHAATHQHGGADEVGTTGPTPYGIVKADADGKIGANWIDDADISLDNVTEGSTNKFFTSTEKTKLSGIAAGAQVNTVASVNTKTGTVVLNQDDVGDGTTYKQFSQTEKSKLASIEAAADVTDAANVGSAIHGATDRTTPVDADTVGLIDSAAGNALKKLSWSNIKATLKNYLDALYFWADGRGGGQTATGGTEPAQTLTLQSTSHGTKGKILFGNSAYDESSNRLGVGTDDPQELVDAVATGSSPRVQARRTDGATCQLIGGASFGVFGTAGNHDVAIFANGAEKARVTTNARLGVNVSAPAGQTHIDQDSTTAAIPVLILDQADTSEEYIEFAGAVGSGNPIQTSALGTYYGKVRVSVNGTFKYIALYNS
jgi:hypothetical protein